MEQQHLSLNGSLLGAAGAEALSATSAGGLPPPTLPLSLHHSLSYTSQLPLHQPAPGLADPLAWSALDVSLGAKRLLEEEYLSLEYLTKRARLNDLLLPRTEPIPSIPTYPLRPGEKLCTFYMTTGTCKFGATCKFDHPIWVPAGGIPDWKENLGSAVLNLEQAANITILPERPGEPDCAFFIKTGDCKFGSKCKFNHPKDRAASSAEGAQKENIEKAVPTDESASKSIKGEYGPAPLNSSGLPLRPGLTECAFYTKTGRCKYGKGCKFHHPETNAGLNALLPASLLSSAAIAGLLPAVVNGFGLTGGNFTLPLSLHPFPVRPGQPECAFYMKTGDCKFGPGCKYNHPFDRFSTKLTAAGLPRREGEPACPYYLKTGVCRFEASCKFDHPPPGEFAAKASSEPPKTQAS